MGEVRLEHRDDRAVTLPPNVPDLAPRVAPDNLVAELDVPLIPPIGHRHRGRRVAVFAVELGAWQRSASRPNGPFAVNIQLAEVAQVGGRFPPSVGVGLPAGNRLAAADDGRFAVRTAIDDGPTAGRRIMVIEDNRRRDSVSATAQHHNDITGHIPVDLTHRIACPLDRTERLIP